MGPRLPLSPSWPNLPSPTLSDPMSWRPGTTPISSAADMIPSPAPTVRCSALGTSWPQLEGSLRTWRCWWVCGGLGSGRTQGNSSSPCDSGTLMCCVQGGAISIHVLWDCNLDVGGSDCQPHYSFQLQQRSYNFRCHCPRPPYPHAAPQPGAPSPSSCGGQDRPHLCRALWMLRSV